MCVCVVRYNLEWFSVGVLMGHRFPRDSQTWDLESQLMWGRSLLVSPVLEEGASLHRIYLPPQAKWFQINYTASSQLTFMVFVCSQQLLFRKHS